MIKTKHIWYGLLTLIVLAAVGAVIIMANADLNSQEQTISYEVRLRAKVIDPASQLEADIAEVEFNVQNSRMPGEGLKREGPRWWVLTYKLQECPPEPPAKTQLRKQYLERANEIVLYYSNSHPLPFSPKEDYFLLLKANAVMEEGLRKIMGKLAYESTVANKASLEEAYGSLERANAMMEKCNRPPEG